MLKWRSLRMPGDAAGTQRARSTETHAEMRNLLQAQKSELTSQLAGALANQFNNVMMSITTYAELELRKASPSQKHNLEEILHNTSRVTALIQRLLAFSRKHAPSPQRFGLNIAVTEIGNLLQPLMGENIHVNVDLDP